MRTDTATTRGRRRWSTAPSGEAACCLDPGAGTMTFGQETDERAAHAQLDAFAEAGGTLIDTADVYGQGASEEIIGRWLGRQPAATRSQVVLATKGRFPVGPGPNDVGLPGGTCATRSTPRCAGSAPTWSTSTRCTPSTRTPRWKRRSGSSTMPSPAGKVSYVGLSNYTGWQVQKIVGSGRVPRTGAARDAPAAVQPARPGDRMGDRAGLRVDRAGAWCPWSPLGGGWLTGKYTRDERPTGATRLGEHPDRGVEAYDRRARVQRTWDVIDTVEAVASSRGVTMPQVALAWLVDRPRVTSVILGARTLEQLQDNLGAAGLHLDPDETARLDAVSDPAPADYPYGGRASSSAAAPSRAAGPESRQNRFESAAPASFARSSSGLGKIPNTIVASGAHHGDGDHLRLHEATVAHAGCRRPRAVRRPRPSRGRRRPPRSRRRWPAAPRGADGGHGGRPRRASASRSRRRRAGSRRARSPSRAR